MAAVSDPCFTPIEEGDEADSLTYNKLGVEVKVAVDKNSPHPSFAKAAAACLIWFWTLRSTLQSSVRILPRFLKEGVIVSG